MTEKIWKSSLCMQIQQNFLDSVTDLTIIGCAWVILKGWRFWPSEPCFFLIVGFSSRDLSYLSVVFLSLMFHFVNGHPVRKIMPSEEVAWLICMSYWSTFTPAPQCPCEVIFSHAHHLAVVQTVWKGLLIRDEPEINQQYCFLGWTGLFYAQPAQVFLCCELWFKGDDGQI